LKWFFMKNSFSALPLWQGHVELLPVRAFP